MKHRRVPITLRLTIHQRVPITLRLTIHRRVPISLRLTIHQKVPITLRLTIHQKVAITLRVMKHRSKPRSCFQTSPYGFSPINRTDAKNCRKSASASSPRWANADNPYDVVPT